MRRIPLLSYLQKAFDRVQHGKLMEILFSKIHKDVPIINDVYSKQRIIVVVETMHLKWASYEDVLNSVFI